MDLSPQMFRDIPKVIKHHLVENNMNWLMTIFMTWAHCAAVVGVSKLTQCSAETLLWAFCLWPISGFGITIGVHRLYAHRSYEAHFIVRFLLVMCNSIASQTSIFHWARDHRIHHKFAETKADPHNANRGFFFAHVGWLLLKKDPAVREAGRTMDFSDLLADPLVYWQNRLDPWFALYMCFVWPAQIASYFWGEQFWNAFFVAGALRFVCILHGTFVVNSAAHLYGDHPYDVLSYAAENPFVAAIALGEGWHNWHHKYPFDYATSEFGVTSQWNPGKLVIDLLAKIGLVWGRKRGTAAWQIQKARRIRACDAGVPLPKAPLRPWLIEKENRAE